jgi:hypothetical protein
MRAVRVAVAMFVAVALLSVSLSVVSAHDDRGDDHGELSWIAKLAGRFEAPTPRVTPARGVALFSMEDGKVNYVIVVARISNVVAAHIHCGPPGVAGAVGVTLFMHAPAGGPVHGVLIRSSFSAPDTGNKCNWTTLADVVAAVAAGNAYVNVHTSTGTSPPNTGPGNFPGGEIRGALRAIDDD